MNKNQIIKLMTELTQCLKNKQYYHAELILKELDFLRNQLRGI